MSLLFKLFFTLIAVYTSIWNSRCFSQAFITTQRLAPIGVVNFETNQQMLPPEGFVDGYVRKSGVGNFTFPVGDRDVYAPFSANADNVSGAYYCSDPGKSNLSRSFAGGPFSPLSKGSTIAKVSAIEFWDINGRNPTNISLTWSAHSVLTSLSAEHNLGLLRIVGWDGVKWVIIPSAVDDTSIFNKKSSITAGSVSTVKPVRPDDYQVYTLAMETPASLPVTLVSFTAKKEGATASLHWVTESEINSSHFEVQRSLDGKNWLPIGIVDCQRDMANDKKSAIFSREYQFTDPTLAPKENLYRLKMIDMDKSFSYSQIRSVFHENTIIAAVYPNPVVDRLYFDDSIKFINAQIALYNSRGENVIPFLSVPIDGISLAHLLPGIYLVSIKSIEGMISNLKIVVNK